jgi:hypothetical protein
MDQSKSDAPPARGWVMITKLRSDTDPEKLHPISTATIAIHAWHAVRANRGDTAPFAIEGAVGKPDHDPAGTLKLYGDSSMPQDALLKALQELSSVLIEVLDQKQVEIFVAGQYRVLMRTQARPHDIKLH